MATILRRLPYSNPGSVGLPSIAPTDDEIALFNRPELLFWLQAENGLGADGWRCRKTGRLFTKAGSALPTPQADAAYGGKIVAKFGTGLPTAGVVYLDGAHPIGSDFSYTLIGRNGPADNAYLMGSGDDPAGGSGTTRTFLQHTATGAIAFHTGTVANASSGTLRPSENGPNIYIGSHSEALKQNHLRVNFGALTGTPAGGASPASGISGIITIGATGTPGSTLSGNIDGGEIADAMVWSVPLHVRTDLRDLVERYCRVRYPSVGL